MLYINGKLVKSPDASNIRKQFGYSFQQDERTAKIIDWYIESSGTHTFNSIQDFTNTVLGHLRTQYLTIQCTHINHPRPYRIVMQGSRSADAAEANKKAGLRFTPGGYTWHHKEHVIFHSPNNIECDMYLIDTDYHRFPHSGGVKEYESRTGKIYH